MNAPVYGFSKEEAVKDGESNRIDQTGKYSGVFTKVKMVTASTGTKGVEFDFKTNTGQVAGGMQVWTEKATGEPISTGQSRMSAILCCLGVPSIKATLQNIKEYDYETKQDEFVSVEMYLEALNKPIGLVLQKELYTKRNGPKAGEDGDRMTMFMPFHAESERNAKEMIEQKDPQIIAQIVEILVDKDDRKRQPAQAPQDQYVPGQTGVAPDGFDDGGDDIPY